MKTTRAPVYTHAWALARWVTLHCGKQRREAHGPLLDRLEGAAQDVLEAVALALSFREGRLDQLRVANTALVRLRMSARLAREATLLEARQLTHVMTEAETVGRMVGAWARSERGERT